MADHERLDRAIEARAVELGMSYVELAKSAGIADVTLRNFRKGRGGSLRPRNERRLEKALGWAPGSIAAVLNGGMPAPDGDELGAVVRTEDELRQLITETEYEIEHLEVRYESNRPGIVAHLERRLAGYRRQLGALRD